MEFSSLSVDDTHRPPHSRLPAQKTRERASRGNSFSVATPLRNAADERYRFSRFVAATEQTRFHSDSDCWPRGLDPIKADDAAAKLVSLFINASRLENRSPVSSVEPRKCDLVPFSRSRRSGSLARGIHKIVRLSVAANTLSRRTNSQTSLRCIGEMFAALGVRLSASFVALRLSRRCLSDRVWIASALERPDTRTAIHSERKDPRYCSPVHSREDLCIDPSLGSTSRPAFGPRELRIAAAHFFFPFFSRSSNQFQSRRARRKGEPLFRFASKQRVNDTAPNGGREERENLANSRIWSFVLLTRAHLPCERTASI